MSMTFDECLAPRDLRMMPKLADHVMDQLQLSGRLYVITGASGGIGRAVAEGLAEGGANVVNASRSVGPQWNEWAAKLAERCQVTVVNSQCDVTDMTQIQVLLTGIRQRFGRIDGFVANAGVAIPKPIMEQTLDEYHTQMNVNVHGVFYCAKSIGPIFKEQGFGNFIITGSISGRVVTVPVDHTTYNTTKAAVIHLGRSLAREWRGFARVNIVSPGYINTAMSTCPASIHEACRMAAMGRQGDVKELKGIFTFLASDASSFVTGAEFTVDGGYTLT
ncbi:unnamed protein product [Penicillium olsonii]|uniref:Ketoreductase domain-containing protein n=1 Tax=Penicillium olsonii TaxID=99116 RepID=A0A9W4HXB8_PENOL|nr:unnamed protein product [Penicillium olsonii]CAG8254563.1 unnamed protein product [Penicillium olsonii]